MGISSRKYYRVPNILDALRSKWDICSCRVAGLLCTVDDIDFERLVCCGAATREIQNCIVRTENRVMEEDARGRAASRGTVDHVDRSYGVVHDVHGAVEVH